jgi:hypothetical protein
MRIHPAHPQVERIALGFVLLRVDPLDLEHQRPAVREPHQKVGDEPPPPPGLESGDESVCDPLPRPFYHDGISQPARTQKSGQVRRKS